MNSFDIAVIGGGHAGVEAAHIAAKFGLSVSLITIGEVTIASAPCNPAVGGVGKGQVVREIDILGGLIGKCADRAGIQFRTLNDSKGYAVRSTRVQIDKDLYPKIVEAELKKLSNLSLISATVVAITKIDDLFKIKLSSGDFIYAKRVILTTGTFLGGKTHCGESVNIGGRHHLPAAPSLSELLPEFKISTMRFKTGTPPRIYTDSIDLSAMHVQESDSETSHFHLLHYGAPRFVEQKSCFLTRTNEQTIEIIRNSRERSPIFNGQIKGVGPRYCPSIEDKAFRYPDRNGHHIFIEPETLKAETIYPNGISTSLPAEIQEQFVRSIPGLENAKFHSYGYAVEYDVIDTTELSKRLEHKEIKGLYFAGQINGTSGYEEAAGQGYIAGVNAALSFKSRELILSREDSYIGVMIEDLVMNKRDEPYRLFTARAENRLAIREDNTLVRIHPYRVSLGLSEEIDQFQARLIAEYDLFKQVVFEKYTMSDDKGYSIAEIVRRDAKNPIFALKEELDGVGLSAHPSILELLAIELYYGGYVEQASVHHQKIAKLKLRKIKWEELSHENNISFECRTRISGSKPETFGELMSIVGIRPATLAYVAGRL